jgi:hypothetical protein
VELDDLLARPGEPSADGTGSIAWTAISLSRGVDGVGIDEHGSIEQHTTTGRALDCTDRWAID